jgi:hypothetical protein
MPQILPDIQHCITPSQKVMVSYEAAPWTRILLTRLLDSFVGDAAVALLKAGVDTTKQDGDGYLALDLAPDKEVSRHH